MFSLMIFLMISMIFPNFSVRTRARARSHGSGSSWFLMAGSSLHGTRGFAFCLEARRSQGASRTQEEPGGLLLAILGRSPLVSDGPMVQDLCY